MDSEDPETLKQKNERLKAALKFYADPQSWRFMVKFDQGEIARTVISQCSEED